jgi:hypothetical protein
VTDRGNSTTNIIRILNLVLLNIIN